MDAVGIRDYRADVATRLGKIAALVGNGAEDERPPPRGDRETVHRRELQQIGRRLFAAGEAARLAEHDGAREVPRIEAASIRADSRSVNAASRASASSSRPAAVNAMPSAIWAYP